MAENGEQNAPIMAGSDDASADEKITGILAQVRHDHAGKPLTEVLHNLRERLEQAQITLDDITVSRYGHEISEAR